MVPLYLVGHLADNVPYLALLSRCQSKVSNNQDQNNIHATADLARMILRLGWPLLLWVITKDYNYIRD